MAESMRLIIKFDFNNKKQSSITIFLRMQTLKKAEALIFQRMHTFQKGSMQSELAFITSQVAKLIFKDTFIITIFIFPLQTVHNAASFFFQLTARLNLAITIMLTIFIVGFVFLGISKMACLQQKSKYFIQILMPWLDIFSMLILTVSFQLLLVNIKENIILIALNIVTIISISFIQIFYNLFNFTKEPRSSNLFKKRQAPVISFCNISYLFFCYYLSISFFSQYTVSIEKAIVYSFIQFLLSLATIKQRVFMQYYLSPFSQNVSSLIYFLGLNTSLLVFLFYILNLDLISANLIFLLIIMTLLEYSALNAYITRRNRNMFLSSAADLKNEDDAILYLDRLCQLITKVENEQESIILISLKKKHMITCKDVACSCRTNEFQLGHFIKEYVRCELQQICDNFHNSISILISTLYFKMVIFKYYPEILAKLNYYSSHLSLSLLQRYYKYCLGQYVTGFIAKKNYEISAVDSEHMFKLEEIRVEIENITKAEIEIRSKQWKYLSRGLCRISELEHNCNLSLKNIARLMAIFDQNKARFKKSKEFNLLLLFYFIKVSFLNNGKQIKQNLKELYFGYKEDQLYSLKEFKKFIYHKRSCVIETLVDTKTMGIITAATRNVEDMFGFPTNKIIGISINSLMPQFMAEEHEDIMSDWAKSGTWRTIGKLKEIYCVHKEQYCFSAIIYLKIYIKDNNMHFITNIFKLNDSDYLIVNPNMKIQGLGRKFLKILGEPAKRMSMELLIDQCGPILSKKTFTEGKIYRKIFLSLKNLESEVDLYLQNINMKFDEGQRKEINEGFHERLLNICQQKYCVQFTIQRYKMGKISFFVICMKQAKKVERHQTANYFDKTQICQHNDNSKEILDFDIAESEDNSFQKQDNELLIEHNASSSLTSLNEKENYPIAKTIEKFIGFVQNPSTITDNRLSNFNLMMMVILLLLSSINFISFYCYKQMLLEIEGIFFADGAQSDIMQTTEICYGYTYVLKSQLINSSNAEFASTLESARLVNNYVYSLREASFQSLITNVTELTKDRLYAYLEKPTFWIMNKHQMTVLTHQFLQNFHYLTAKLFNEFQRLKVLNQTDINSTLLYQLFSNFPQMQNINQFFLNDYQRISDKQHLVLSYFTIVSMVVYFILSLILSFAMNNYFKFRFNQLINSFTFLSYIPSQYLEKMKEYYVLLITKIIDTDKLKSIDSHEEQIFEIDTYDLFHRNDPNKSSASTKIRFINYQHYYKWIFIFLIFCLLNGLNFIATSQIRDFFPSSQTVIREVNDLMRSENKLLQNYFNLRAAYSLNPNKYINQSLYEKLMVTLNQTETKFNSIANKLTTIFKDYDSNYQHNFVNALVNSVCKLSQSYLTPFQTNKCVKEMTLNILDGGILISMNFFQRNVRTALEDLKMQYMTKNATKYQGDYFRQLDFVELDKMLIYMFKIYQLTQAVTYNSYIAVIQTITTSYLHLTIGLTAFFIAVMLLWLKSINAQKESLSYLYGHLLLIPFMILKSNTRISSSLKEAVEYLNG